MIRLTQLQNLGLQKGRITFKQQVLWSIVNKKLYFVSHSWFIEELVLNYRSYVELWIEVYIPFQITFFKRGNYDK